MPLQHLLVIYLVGTLLVFLPSFGFAKLFPKAGHEAWKAYVPFYNTWIIQEITSTAEALGVLAIYPCGGLVYFTRYFY
ncbi:MAG: DUF5684 domain-containing protein [Chitinophagaceae bacterium]